MTEVLALVAVITLLVTMAGSGVLFYMAAYTDKPEQLLALWQRIAGGFRR